MKFIRSIFLFAALVSSLAACKKEDNTTDDQPEEKHMEITVQNPVQESVYEYNEVITVSGSIQSNFDAHGYIVRLWNSSNNDSLLYEVDGHEHGEAIDFNETWTNNLNDTSEVRIEVIASSDHQGTYTESEELMVTCYPD